MSLKDRLTRLTGEATKPLSTEPQEDRTSELHRKLDRAMHRRPQTHPADVPVTRRAITPLQHVVIGEEVRTSYGNFFASRKTMNADAVHGGARICDIACASMGAVAFLAGLHIGQDLTLSDGLFLDSETTGLTGGTGTFPFLIGLGWFEAGTFVTCQLFARDFSEEGAMLRYLGDLTSGKRFLVTFNGKAYDLNLLVTRFILNRCSDTLSTMPHIDLLHPSRRILAHRLENARLSTIERHVLGVERDGDVPGFEIPQRYFDWLRRRDGRLMEDVFIHNRMDIVSMASLLKYLSDLVEGTQESGHTHHGDILKIAGLFHERGDHTKARSMLQPLISSHDMDVAVNARQMLSLIYKKIHRWQEAAELWQNLIALNPHNLFAVEELAKFYEHHTHECGKALQLVRKLLDENRYLNEAERASAEHRLRRLLHKVSSE
jgi:uncharacterized protein